MKKAIVEDHKATYLDPIAVKAGDMISLSGKTDNWDGHTWLWAEGLNGKAGWIPDSLVRSADRKTYAIRDYSAAELTCRKGEVLLVTEETHGWAWCRSDSGKQGWVPLRNLSSPEPTSRPCNDFDNGRQPGRPRGPDKAFR
ncbi:hypothetical protein G6L08_34860 [Agrobacterium rhizogenes]|nr:hypothetical protein [Rhizobium rhizogenes]